VIGLSIHFKKWIWIFNHIFVLDLDLIEQEPVDTWIECLEIGWTFDHDGMAPARVEAVENVTEGQCVLLAELNQNDT
jgi:hypothetical protein